MKYHILILVESPFGKRDYERFGVEILERHFAVTVLDFTPWLKPHVWAAHSVATHQFAGYRPVCNEADFNRTLPDAENNLAIDYLGAELKSKKIRARLALAGIPRAVVRLGLWPAMPQTTLLQKIRKLKYRANITRHIADKIVYLASSKLNGETPPEIALVSGTESLKDSKIEPARKIWAHSFDYDIYLQLRELPRDTPKPYAVFIDQDLAHHPDFFNLGVKPLVREENYYPALMHFFAEFEKATGLEVVFAAHPRSRWDLRPLLLAGRVPVSGKTAELIRDAQLVFSHTSTSISFAVLWQRPLVFLTSEELGQGLYRDEILIRSQLLGAPLINIDDADQADFELAARREIDREAYAAYKERFIKKNGTPELPVWEIFAQNVEHGCPQ